MWAVFEWSDYLGDGLGSPSYELRRKELLLLPFADRLDAAVRRCTEPGAGRP